MAPAAVPLAVVLPEKYASLRMGSPADAPLGIKALLGVSDADVAEFFREPEEAIKRECVSQLSTGCRCALLFAPCEAR